MDLDVRRGGDFIQVEAGFGEAAEGIEPTTLQQFGQGALESDLETRVGAEAGKAALIAGVQQGDVHHRKFAA